MISNSDVTAPQQLGNVSSVSLFDKANNLKDKALAWQPSKNVYMILIGACVILIVERKIRYKPKTYKFNMGGKKQ
jgi:hypothetical protein